MPSPPDAEPADTLCRAPGSARDHHPQRGRWFAALGLAMVVVAGAGAIAAQNAMPVFFHSRPDPLVQQGARLYAENCASCHGARLEGQPDWQQPNPDGTYPAPPHDETGHTWHHGDGMLSDYIRRGGQAALDDMGVAFTSGMPGFGAALSGADIAAVLAFIKSTWPERIRAVQAERTAAEALE